MTQSLKNLTSKLEEHEEMYILSPYFQRVLLVPTTKVKIVICPYDKIEVYYNDSYINEERIFIYGFSEEELKNNFSAMLNNLDEEPF